MTILKKIVEYKKDELLEAKRRISFSDLKKRAADAEPARPFLKNFIKGQINIIAEIKKASPSLGIIREDFKPVDIALQYEENGARALSVLTDEKFFQGSLSYLSAIKQKVSLPCLRKDFTLSDYHLFEARAFEADAVLLIAAILDEYQIKDFCALSLELGMIPLVEIHDEKDLVRATSRSPLQGINNRNLKTFEVNLQTSYDLVSKIPEQATKISESGLKNQKDLIDLMQAGFDGFLIGETFLKEKNPGEALKKIIS